MIDDLKKVLDWYKENGVMDFVNEEAVNHLESKNKETKVNKKTQTAKPHTNENVQSRNMNDIINMLALKHKNKKKNLEESKDMLSPKELIDIARSVSDRVQSIEELRDEVEKFEGCYSIKKLATNTVFGEGNTKSDILIIGEAPGNNEDLQGRPFCGQSGILLDNMFKAIGYKREDLYITNTLFWRPPGNRTPTPEELAMCKPFVEKHIALINPKVIIMMGSTALRNLINTSDSITRARRKFFEYNNPYLEKSIKATPLFHPSYLLRQPIKKRDAWKDLLFLKEFLNDIYSKSK